jgi:hypothetical protein
MYDERFSTSSFTKVFHGEEEEEFFSKNVEDIVSADGTLIFSAWTKNNKIMVWIRSQFR